MSADVSLMKDLARSITLLDMEDAIVKRLAIPEALEACRHASDEVADRRVSVHIGDYGDNVSFRINELVARVSRDDMRELLRLYQEADARVRQSGGIGSIGSLPLLRVP